MHPSVTARLVASGEWQLLWRGMYLCTSVAPSALTLATAAIRHAQQRCVQAAAQPRPVMSGLAGAAALGLRWVPEHTRVQVLVGPEVRRPSYEGVLVRRTWDVAGISTWNWGGLPVAPVGRLVVDGARECRSLRDVRGLALGAAADGWTNAAELRALVDAGAVATTAWVRRAIVDIERGAASPPEAEVADFLVGRRLPLVLNAALAVGGGLLGVADGYLLGTGVGYEVDSVERHSGPALSATLDRHERTGRGGVHLVHVTPGSFRADPGNFLARLLSAVAERAASGLGEPAGLVVSGGGPVLR